MYLDRLLTVLTIVAWLVTGLALLRIFRLHWRRHGILGALWRALTVEWVIPVFVVLALTAVRASLLFIPPDRAGVVVSLMADRGYFEKPLASGLHWILPLVDHVVQYPISWQTYTMSMVPEEGATLGDDSISSRTRDGQLVNLDCSVIFRVDPERVAQVHALWQQRFVKELVRPVLRGLLREEVAQFTAEEVNGLKRNLLETRIETALREVLQDNGLQLSRFMLRQVEFSQEFQDAVERKQVAQQKAAEAENLVLARRREAQQAREVAAGKADALIKEAEAEATARVMAAAADARGLELMSRALADNPRLVTYEYVKRLSPNVKVMLVPSDAPFILPSDTLGSFDVPEAATVTPAAVPAPTRTVAP